MGSTKGDFRKVETPLTNFHLPTPVANIRQELCLKKLDLPLHRTEAQPLRA
jgi:hypothetical protein